jgi:hypothetical protein
MAQAQVAAEVVKLPNVRLSFPSLTEFETYEGKPTGKYTATFLINKRDKATLKAVDTAISNAVKLAWPTKAPKDIILTLRDGDDETYDGYEGMMALKAGRKTRPLLMDADKEMLTPEEANDVIYAGCYVNATVDFNASRDAYGKNRVWCNLRGVQFRKDGDRFASGAPVSDNEFDDFDDEEDDPLD